MEPIGAGGMGEVYLAIDTRLGRRVALKFLPSDVTRDPERVRRFRQEARAASALNHPNILTVYELAESGDTSYIAAEFVDGETLRKRLTRGRMPLRDVLSIATQITSALGAAHTAGVIHRDVKPENVMIRGDGYVKVLDFGLAKLTEANDLVSDVSTNLRTGDGSIKGTSRYMSPEQIAGSSVDARSDLWSVGVVLYEMLAGRRPFEGSTHGEVFAQVLQKEPPPLEVPEELRRIVAKALRKGRDERYQSADDLLSDLRKFEKGALSRRALRVGIGVAAVIVVAVPALLFVSNRKPVPHATSQSVAVLPFVNMSGDPSNDFLSDGMSEELIDSLAHVQDLKVVSRTSSFAFKGKNADIREVAEKLGVGTVVEGSVRKAGNRLRVTAQLVNATDGYQLWSNTFERDATDIFAIEDEIAGAVANALRTRLGASAHAHRPDLVAYELYLKGRKATQTRTRESREQAILYLQEAIARDPSFSDAYAGLAEIYSLLDHGPGESTLSSSQTYALALDASRRALELDPDCADAYGAAGHVLTHQGKFIQAEDYLRRAIRLNPNSAMSHLWYGVLLATTQRHAEVKAHFLRARELDPLALQIPYIAGFTMTRTGDFVAAEQLSRAAIELGKDLPYPYTLGARVESLLGKRREAEAMLADAKARGSEQIDVNRAYVSAVTGNAAEAVTLLRRIERGNPKLKSEGMMTIMDAWAAAGNNDKAAEWLDRFVKTTPGMATVNVDLPPHPVFASFRRDPRFLQARRGLGLPPLVDSR